MNLIADKEALDIKDIIGLQRAEEEGLLPYSLQTIYKWKRENRYPKLIVKLGRNLFWNKKEWVSMMERKIQEQVEEAKRRINNTEPLQLHCSCNDNETISPYCSCSDRERRTSNI